MTQEGRSQILCSLEPMDPARLNSTQKKVELYSRPRGDSALAVISELQYRGRTREKSEKGSTLQPNLKIKILPKHAM